MKIALAREHRKTLETVIAQARVVAESGAVKALQALAVGAKEAPAHFTKDQIKLRVRLRAHGRQLGDVLRPDDTQAVNHLITEVAYEHWHRMLFARFLAESNLLMHPHGYPVTLQDCKEDAATLEPPARSEWEVAGRYASAMLPNVFRPDTPTLALELPLETEQALEALLNKLPATAFQADDSLGWSYQFWQAPKKEEVQRQMKQAGTKVGADELPAVTQLFTEQYMVAFLLENSLGGWWLGRHPGKPLPIEMPYLRTMEDGAPAAGTFAAWPDTLTDFKLLDPSCGSGHFTVSALYYLVPLRVESENISVREAVDKVLADNLYGLELDARCVEIAAFALALAAWRYPDESGKPLGHRPLPRLNIACCGVAPRTPKATWLKLANGDRQLEHGMEALYALYQKAPELGSLIDPGAVTRGDLVDANWDELQVLMEKALANPSDDETEVEARVAAQGMAFTTRILSRRYHLVITNPPYLGSGQHGPVLKDFCDEHYKTAKGDLANVFLERCLKLCNPGGVVQFVMPQNWLFLKAYQKQREYLLRNSIWSLLARLGSGAFETITGEVVNAILLTLIHSQPAKIQMLRGLDASSPKSAEEKAVILSGGLIVEISQAGQFRNPDARVSLSELGEGTLLSVYADSFVGLGTGDFEKYGRKFWEFGGSVPNGWSYLQCSPVKAGSFEGLSHLVAWDYEVNRVSGMDALHRERIHNQDQSGQQAWGKKGVAVSLMGDIKATQFQTYRYDKSQAVIVPKQEGQLPAIWAYCSSPQYHDDVRQLEQAVIVASATLVKVPFDFAHWQQVAAERYPTGLPKPYSDDITQWIFHGHPKPSIDPPQVAVARLIGYRWPAESDAEMELSDEARNWISRCAELDDLTDDDGIVCLPAVRGEPAAIDRLRALLARAFGADWSAAREAQLLTDAGCDGMPLVQWLRDKFFEQHISRFGKRPFIWHVWDGHKEGFSALINYHQLTHEKLTTLIHLYLGDWITQQKRAVDAGNADAVLKLAKAEALKIKLEAILTGEPPYDIFVRWKPLHQLPLGWEPDLNDGVRMNIRPFVAAEVLRIPRAKLGIKWESDRGKDVPSAPWYRAYPVVSQAY